jgi:hypothetical protein
MEIVARRRKRAIRIEVMSFMVRVFRCRGRIECIGRFYGLVVLTNFLE